MDIWACIRTETLLEGAKKAGWFDTMRKSGIEGFMVKAFDVSAKIPTESVAECCHILKEEGLGMMGLGLPTGHPEGLDTPCYTFHEGWHIRRDINNELIPWCNAITPQLISDVRHEVEVLADIGVARIFWDDDLRQGNFGGGVQGCFCDDCIAEFAETNAHVIPKDFSRESLRPVIDKIPQGLTEEQLALREAWMDFHSERVVRFLQGMTFEGMKSGIMVMCEGDRRHGIDLAAIEKAIPDCYFRVGELMFGDAGFEKAGNKTRLVRSILNHKALLSPAAEIFSESTVFPHGALTPENLRKKIILERRCGLEHINLMGIERMNHPDYYTMLAENLEAFRAIRPDLTLENAHLAEEV